MWSLLRRSALHRLAHAPACSNTAGEVGARKVHAHAACFSRSDAVAGPDWGSGREARLAYEREVSARRKKWRSAHTAKVAALATAKHQRLEAEAAARAERRAAQAATVVRRDTSAEDEAEAARLVRLTRTFAGASVSNTTALTPPGAHMQAEARQHRLSHWQRRQAALQVARARREEELLARSATWVQPQQLDARIAHALAHPVLLT